MTGQSMLDRIARYPLWLALAMMAPLAGLVVMAAGMVPFVECRYAQIAGIANANPDGGDILVVLAAHRGSAYLRVRMIRVLCHPI